MIFSTLCYHSDFCLTAAIIIFYLITFNSIILLWLYYLYQYYYFQFGHEYCQYITGAIILIHHMYFCVYKAPKRCMHCFCANLFFFYSLYHMYALLYTIGIQVSLLPSLLHNMITTITLYHY